MFDQVDGLVRLLAVKELLGYGCTWDPGRVPTVPSHACAHAPLLRGHCPRGPWLYEVVNATLLEACLRYLARIVDALKKRINLDGSLQPTHGLVPCSLDLFLVATFEFILQLILAQRVHILKIILIQFLAL